jgi:hypothetical protein
MQLTVTHERNLVISNKQTDGSKTTHHDTVSYETSDAQSI